jgi:molybdopterin molybdotransferase
MISVDEAVRRVSAAFAPVDVESVAIADAAGRVLAEDAVAKLDQPPHPVSAMDGYAVRAEDAATVPARLRRIGSAPAGHPFEGRVGAGEAVRIFTGGVVPDGADSIVIQENARTDGDWVMLDEPARAGRHIRVAGLDFHRGDVLVECGRRLKARDLALLAAGDIAAARVRRRPRVCLAATGDELSRPGQPRKSGGIVASSVYGLSAMVAQWGGEPLDLGILPDTAEALGTLPALAKDADLIVTMGGASVGDHDLVQSALAPHGFALDFWKIAMRPGKPLVFGRLGTTPLLGLPGNPVSSLVCAILFLRPAIAAMLGESQPASHRKARLAASLPANDSRQDYVRSRLELRDGEVWATPFPVQDSSMQRALAQSDALIIRPPLAPAAAIADRVEVIALDDI